MRGVSSRGLLSGPAGLSTKLLLEIKLRLEIRQAFLTGRFIWLSSSSASEEMEVGLFEAVVPA